MVTDRKIIVENERAKKEITKRPLFVEKIEGFDSLEVTIVTSQGYGQDGTTVVNSYIGARPMNIQGKFIAESTREMQAARDEIINLFAPKTKLTITHTFGGVTRKIEAMTEKTPRFGFTDVSKVQSYEVDLSASFPFWKDERESIVRGADWKGGLHFPLHIPLPGGTHFGVKSKSKIVNVHNSSQMKIGMTYTFVAKGTVTNPQLFNVNTREFMKIYATLKPGEFIEVRSGEEKTVTDSEGNNRIGQVDIIGGGDSFLELEPGDNLFRYAADAGEDVMELRIAYMNLYYGV